MGAEAERDPRRDLPSVDALARRAGAGTDTPAALLLLLAREVLDTARAELASGTGDAARAGDLASLLDTKLRGHLEAAGPLRELVNGTGVLLHTNLGRAPLMRGPEASGPAAIELDLHSGRRGRRMARVEALLRVLTGAEDALVVNNNAAAVLLALSAVGADPGRDGIVISRGELVEIGGGFRVPEVIVQGGARLVEVGTTNRTHLRDYASAIDATAAAVLRVHASNYTIAGFTATPSLSEIARLCSERRLPLLFDLGSGLLDEAAPWLPCETADAAREWLAGEPAARQSLEAGADLVLFSGDKLLGGPQAGIACGRADLVSAMRSHPLARAMRYDGARAAILEPTLEAYLTGTATETIPLWRMVHTPISDLMARARGICDTLPPDLGALPVESRAFPGAGSSPGRTMPSAAVRVPASGRPDATVGSRIGPDRALAHLRHHEPAVIARTDGDAILVDLRAVPPVHDKTVTDALSSLVAARPRNDDPSGSGS